MRARGLFILAALATVVAVAITFLLFLDLREDDAYITLQFARNIASGHGFTFNPGERILGATSPLHTFLLAAAYPLAGDSLPEVSILLGAVGLVGQAWFLALLLRPISRPIAAIAAVATWAGLAGPHLHLPLETNLFAALVLATLWALQEERVAWCGALLGLCFLCRYDAGLLIPILVAIWWRRHRQLPKTTLAVSFAVVAPWLIGATWYFGSFLPHTFWAKLSVTPFGPYLTWVLGAATLQPWQALGLGRFARSLAPITVAGWAIGAVMIGRRYRTLVPFLAFATALLFAYSWIGPSPDHQWHTYPSLLALDLLLLLGPAGILQELATREGRAVPAVRVVLAAVASALLVALSVRTVARARELRTEFWYGWRDGVYRKVAAWTGEHLRPEASILASEVGTLGYLTRHRMIDPYGLINETNDYPRTASLPSLLGLVGAYRPDVILANDLATAAALERQAGYVVVRLFEWRRPWSVVLVRSRSSLRDPGELAALRAEFEAYLRRLQTRR